MQYLFPQTCVICNRIGRYRTPLCQNCIDQLPRLQQHCLRCANPLPRNEVCGRCLQNSPAYDKVVAAFLYQTPIDQLINQFKYQQGYHIGEWLAELWMQTTQVDFSSIDCIMPVPMHRNRLRKRGYNQAAILTKHLAHASNRRIDLHALKKIKQTTAQSTLPARQRQQLSSKVFSVNKLAVRHVALIDDVMTTGSTLDAVATCLKNSGIQSVTACVVARTHHH